jgi:isoleucyl-tRNA synthetase
MFATHDPEQNLLFGYKRADETRRRFHLMLWNIYNFFISYASIDKWESDKTSKKSENILDIWILSRLNQTIIAVTNAMENYSAQKASLSIEEFVTDMSLWYVRRSRDRVGPSAEDGVDKSDCYETLYTVLVNLAKLLAPFTPFLADDIYVNLTGDKSVHLSDWPEANEASINKDVNAGILTVRKIVEAGHAKRKEIEIKVRQPLANMTINPSDDLVELSENFIKLIKEELNVKEVHVSSVQPETVIHFDTKLTEDLQEEGQARDLVRMIQEQRKKMGTAIDEKVNVELPSWPVKHEMYIRKNALIENLTKSEQFSVTKL